MFKERLCELVNLEVGYISFSFTTHFLLQVLSKRKPKSTPSPSPLAPPEILNEFRSRSENPNSIILNYILSSVPRFLHLRKTIPSALRSSITFNFVKFSFILLTLNSRDQFNQFSYQITHATASRNVLRSLPPTLCSTICIFFFYFSFIPLLLSTIVLLPYF